MANVTNKIVCDKLVLVLSQIIDSNKTIDETYLEILLKLIVDELKPEKNGYKKLRSSSIINWVVDNKKLFCEHHKNPHISEFILRITGVLCKYPSNFKSLKESSIINDITSLDIVSRKVDSSVKLAYIFLLTNIIQNESGCGWMIETRQWKDVVKLCLQDNSLYVQREGGNFIVEYLKKTSDNIETCEELLRYLLLPLVTTKELSADVYDKLQEDSLEKQIKPTLLLLKTILSDCLTNKQTINNIPSLLYDVFCIEPILKKLTQVIESHSFLELVTHVYALLILTYIEYNEVETIDDVYRTVGATFLEQHIDLISRNKIVNAMCFSDQVIISFNKLTRKQQLTNDCGYDFEFQLSCIQLMPLFMFIKSPKKNGFFMDFFIEKITGMTCETAQRLAFLMKGVVENDPDANIPELATKGVMTLMGNVELLPRKRAVIVFQSLMYVLKEFMPVNNEMEVVTVEEAEEIYLLSVSAEPLLRNALDAIITLIDKFKINWSESVESICVLKFTAMLLNNPHITSRIVVQTLKVAQLAIMNSMPPSLALLVDDIKGSSFVCLGPLLYKNLHDRTWEVRDSCLEVILVMAELAEIKYTSFQDLLIDNNICRTVVQIAHSDGEHYVRATAIKVVTAMARSDRLWVECNKELNIVERTLGVLKNDEEAIIRREAALLIKQIYINNKYSVNILKDMYEVTLACGMNDLHWEVKVNCILFWEKVIDTLFTTQGMIDGIFPQVTFSKDSKKIVQLTENEIRTRISKILKEMSELGCTQLLMTTLLEDPDIQVVQESAKILNRLKTLLYKYKLLHDEDELSSKRKTSACDSLEKRLAAAPVSISVDLELGAMDSDVVIDDIVNERDVNLLAGVLTTNTTNKCKQINELHIKKLDPDLFLAKLRNLDVDYFVNDKINWLTKHQSIDDVLDEILSMSNDLHVNMADCY